MKWYILIYQYILLQARWSGFQMLRSFVCSGKLRAKGCDSERVCESGHQRDRESTRPPNRPLPSVHCALPPTALSWRRTGSTAKERRACLIVGRSPVSDSKGVSESAKDLGAESMTRSADPSSSSLSPNTGARGPERKRGSESEAPPSWTAGPHSC